MTPYYYSHPGAESVMSVALGFLLLLIFLAVCAGIIFLHVLLSRKESRWPGLIFPVISFGFSMLIVFSMAVFTTVTHEAQLTRIYYARLVEIERLDEFRERNAPFTSPEHAARVAEVAEIIESQIAEYTRLIDASNDGTLLLGASTADIIGRSVIIFVITNIPTLVFLMIYVACRGNRKRQRALDVMTVQDLE